MLSYRARDGLEGKVQHDRKPDCHGQRTERFSAQDFLYMVSPSLGFADEETETQTGGTRSLPGVPWPCKRKSQRKTFGALVFELKNLNYFLYGLQELAEQMDVVCMQTHVQTHSHTPLPTQRLKRCTAPAPTGQRICQPRGRLGSRPPLLLAGPGVCCVFSGKWPGEVRWDPPTPPCQVRSEDRGCGSRGRPDVMWACLAGLPTCRKVALPFAVTQAPAPLADLPARVRAG